MNASQCYKFFLNLSPAILHSYQFMFSVLSKAQVNTQTKAPAAKALRAGRAVLVVHSWSILPSGDPSGDTSKHAQCLERSSIQRVRCYLHYYLERKGALGQVMEHHAIKTASVGCGKGKGGRCRKLLAFRYTLVLEGFVIIFYPSSLPPQCYLQVMFCP